MKFVEVQVLKNKIIINSSNVQISQKLLQLLREFGIEPEAIVLNIRCG